MILLIILPFRAALNRGNTGRARPGKYVVMSREHYAHLRECELEAALAESKADLNAGRFVKESVEQHIKRLAKLAA
jgi:hypothetical protein